MDLTFRVGEAVTLCWQLERSPGTAAGHDSNTVQYDVTAMVRRKAFYHALWCAHTCSEALLRETAAVLQCNIVIGYHHDTSQSSARSHVHTWYACIRQSVLLVLILILVWEDTKYNILAMA